MEILGEVKDISIPLGTEGKIKIRTVNGGNIVVEKIELLYTKEGKITQQ